MASPAATDRLPPAGAAGPFLARLFAFAEARHLRLCLLLAVITLACALPGFTSLQPMDRDEPRFAQATKQMLETGDFVDIRFQQEARHKKPVGIHWMQAAVVAAAEGLGVPEARTTVALYRLPSLLGAVAAVLLSYWAALAFVARREAFLAAAFIGCSVMLMQEARLAKTDAMLLACSVAAMGGLARAYLARGVARLPGLTVGVFWSGIALGILIKGPMVLMFAGLCALALSVRERSGRWLLALRPGLGIPATIIVVAPWFVAIALKSDGAFFATAVSEDLLGKVSTGQQNHWGPPGFYFVAFFLTFWPAAALAAMALPFVWSRRRDDGVAFLIAWVAPSWLLFEAFSTKLPHYVLPLYPAIAIATAMAISRGAVGPHRKGATGVALLIPGIPIALTVGLVSGTWALDRTLPVAALPVLLAACVLSVLAWWAFSRAEVMRSAFTSLAAAILLALGVLGIAQLNLPALKISPRLADIARSAPCQAPEVGTLGYREPSLVFLVGTDLEMFPNAQAAAEFTGRGGCRVTFVERRHEADYKAALAARNLTPELAARVPGFNINSGRRTEVAAYLTRPLAP